MAGKNKIKIPGNSDSKAVEDLLAEMAWFPEMNPGPVCRMDRNVVILLANSAARSIFNNEMLVGCSWLDICPGMDDMLWNRVLNSSDNIQHESEVNDACLSFIYRRFEKNNDVFAYGSDITDRKKDQKQLAEQAALLAEVARFPDMNPGPVLRMDTNSCILLANIAAKNIFGDELVGKYWRNICKEISDDKWIEILQAKTPIPFEASIGNRDYIFTHRCDSKSKLVFVYGTDITLQKKAERALLQSEKMATLGTLSAGVGMVHKYLETV